MDIFAHGLWTNAIFESVARVKQKTRSRREIWLAILFGVAPDIFAFGSLLITNIVTGFGNYMLIPSYVYGLYNFSHSLLIFISVFIIVGAIRGRPYWLLSAWGLHILIDLYSHSRSFFATPFLFPLSSFTVSGISWDTPIFFALNYIALAVVYLWLYAWRKSKVAQNENHHYTGHQ